MSEEVWKTIKYNTNYEINNSGIIRNKKNNSKHLKQAINSCGYYIICLSKNNKRKTYTIHKLVIEHFNRSRLNLEVVNHIDGNKLNNHIDNLEYVSQKENVAHAWKNKLCKSKTNNQKINCLVSKNKFVFMKMAKKINQYSLNNEFIKQWDSIKEAKRILVINDSNIIECCKGKRKTAGGFIWRYANEMC